MFELHSSLAEDCYYLGDFTLSRLLLMNDCQYPWFILVPQVNGVSEIYQLSQRDQGQLVSESSMLSETLASVFHADKINIAALGNIVPQLHLHHIVRYKTDVAWPQPIWGKKVAKPYEDAQVTAIREKLILAFSLHFKPLES